MFTLCSPRTEESAKAMGPIGIGGPAGGTRHPALRLEQQRTVVSIGLRLGYGMANMRLVLDAVNLARWSFCFRRQSHTCWVGVVINEDDPKQTSQPIQSYSPASL